MAQARRSIGLVKRALARVEGLLTSLGDSSPTISLASRFRRLTRRLERSDLEATTAARFGRLTQAMHALNRRLSRDFYPGS